MTTIEGNKLIAEFMGWKRKPGYEFIWVKNHKKENGVTEDNLKFHSSWDWLMPVVKKINDMFGKKSEELSNHSRDQEHLEKPLDNPLHWKSWSYHWIHLSTDIDRVWGSVVKSIQWYNLTTRPAVQKD